MTRWIVASERVGTVGEEFDAEAAAASGVNVDALIAGRFIAKSSPRRKATPTIGTETGETPNVDD